MRQDHDNAVQQYIQHTFVREDALLQRIRNVGEELRPGMQVSPNEGKLLYCLAKIVRAKRVLEIGTFIGYSSLWLTRALPKDGMLLTLEYDPKHAKIARKHLDASEVGNKVTVIEGKALESIDKIIREPEISFDLVFIDAAKNEYADYLEKVKNFVPEGGLVIGDNSLLFGAMAGRKPDHVSDAAVKSMSKFNKMLADSDEFEGILIPTEEGLTIGRRRPVKSP